jgi:serine/threonine-protein kinase RIO1
MGNLENTRKIFKRWSRIEIKGLRDKEQVGEIPPPHPRLALAASCEAEKQGKSAS